MPVAVAVHSTALTASARRPSAWCPATSCIWATTAARWPASTSYLSSPASRLPPSPTPHPGGGPCRATTHGATSLAWTPRVRAASGASADHRSLTTTRHAGLVRTAYRKPNALAYVERHDEGNIVVPPSQPRVSRDDVELPTLASFRAHSETVYTVQCISQPPSLLTSSFDRMAALWSRRGACLGAFRQAIKPECVPHPTHCGRAARLLTA